MEGHRRRQLRPVMAERAARARAGMPVLVRIAAWLLCLGLAAVPAAAQGADQPPRGPVVAIPDCRIISEGCSLDEDSPDLSAAGCAVNLAGQLQRRGISSKLLGPTTVLCGPGSSAVVVETTITATCPNRAENELPMTQVKQIDLVGDLVIRDCATGEVVGRGKARRAIDWQRHNLIRDLTEELGHHIKELTIRKSHPETPVRWMLADVGGERFIEISGGVVDLESSELNDYLHGIGLEREQYGHRVLLEMGFHPWRDDNYRFAFGMEAFKFKSEGTGNFRGGQLGLNPATILNQAGIKADIGVVGLRGSIGYGFDITRNQRVSLQASIGYYLLGLAMLPATLEVEGLPAGEFELRDANVGGSGEVRYDWRFTPHLGFTVSGGWNQLTFPTPNRVGRDPHFDLDVEFTGATGRAGLSARF